jgi:hypothetical protein
VQVTTWLLAIVIVTQGVVGAGSYTDVITWNAETLKEVFNPSGRFYVYAPSVIVEGPSTEHYWTCENRIAGEFRDNIFYLQRVNGIIKAVRPVFSPRSPGAWNSVHVCDPSVVAGKFSYNSVVYSYAMFYLGTDMLSNTHNQVGVAFSNVIGGNWVRCRIPVITYPNDRYWGVGQPSVISVDHAGLLLLFYTRGSATGTHVYLRELNFSDMNRALIGHETQLTEAGLTGVNGLQDYLNNIDVAYDATRGRYLVVREQHPYPTDYPNYIGSSLQVVSIRSSQITNGTWSIEGAISPTLTGFPRNHNGGIKRTAYGELPDPDSIWVAFSKSCAGDGCSVAEWTYDLWEVQGTFKSVALTSTVTTMTATSTFPSSSNTLTSIPRTNYVTASSGLQGDRIRIGIVTAAAATVLIVTYVAMTRKRAKRVISNREAMQG